jgi:hypothetical protein
MFDSSIGASLVPSVSIHPTAKRRSKALWLSLTVVVLLGGGVSLWRLASHADAPPLVSEERSAAAPDLPAPTNEEAGDSKPGEVAPAMSELRPTATAVFPPVAPSARSRATPARPRKTAPAKHPPTTYDPEGI